MNKHNFHLITHLLCPYVQRSIITLEEKGVSYTRTDIDLANKPHWFKQKSPLGKVPILIVDDQHTLFESTVICEYLNEVTPGSLLPENSLEKAYHRSWIEFGSTILSNIAQLYSAKTKAEFSAAHSAINHKLHCVEQTLSKGAFFSGDKFHLIDGVYGTIFRYFDVFDTFTRSFSFHDFPKIQCWRSVLTHRHSIKNAVGQTYSTKLIEFLMKKESVISEIILANNQADATQ